MKTETWLELFHFITSVENSDKELWGIVFKNEIEEVVSVFKNLKDKLHELKDKYEKTLIKVQKEYDRYKNISNQKEFALTIQNSKYKHIFFGARSGKRTLEKGVQHYLLEKKQ